ncbi:MAG: hypothetical protein IAF58_18105 [Leptolyngbya sp.]|nr:hypothetical protein [Candidatus Melainabacteria bacterium]
MKKTAALALSLTFLFSAHYQPPAQACSFGSDPYFTYTLHPDFPMRNYAVGQLGILQNTYARSYLLVAQRYLADKPLSKEEQSGVEALWKERFDSTYMGCSANTDSWLKLRGTIPGITPIKSIDTERAVSKEDEYNTYCNAQSSAFETATKTLQTLITKYGIGSEQVKQWTAAQDQVFSNAGSPQYSGKIPVITIPTELPADADAFLKQERNYQIAAANFYAQNFDDAIKQFDAIAADSASRWKQLAAYLAVRAMVRKANLPKVMDKPLMEQALKKSRELAADPNFAALKSDIDAVTSFVAARIAPNEHLQELVTQKLTQDNASEITKTLDNFIDPSNDGNAVLYQDVPAELKKNPVIDWILAFQSTDDAGTKHSIDKWKETHSTEWLVAAIAAIDSDDASANAVIAAAKANKSNAAKWILFHHVNRLEADQNKTEAVRVALDKVINAPPADLPAGSLNEIKKQRLRLSRDVNEFVKFGVQTPLAICSDGGIPQLPDEAADLEGKGKNKPTFTEEAGNVLTLKMPLSQLRQVATKSIPTDLRNDVAWTAWVRAVLIGDEVEAKQLALIAQPLNKAKSKMFAEYLAAMTPEAKKFAAVYLMSHFSSARPNASAGVLQDDSYGDSSGWWWSEKPVEAAPNDGDGAKVETFKPLFINAAQQKELAGQLAKLKTVDCAPNYFAKVILAYAKAHPSDPRLPEALHYGVKSTRYGMTTSATTALSKEMFSLLHTKYKGNSWTKQTPYWF